MIPLEEKLRNAAVAPILLVACDFDGTLAPIARSPQEAVPDEESLAALEALAGMPHTHAAVISGRALDDLSHKLSGVSKLWLVGSHGAEFGAAFLKALPPAVLDLLARVRSEVVRIAAGIEGALIEDKPASVAFHFRNAPQEKAGPALEAILHGPATWEGVHTRPGLKVIELSVAPGNKGRALAAIRHRVGASTVVFIGDDVTDEDAFGVLGPTDLGVKVGEGPTRAPHRVESAAQVPEQLRRMLILRNDWLQGRDLVPIERHSILSDQRTIAVVDPRGRIVWMCAPRADSSALFAELVGGSSRGYFEVRPVDAVGEPRQSYVNDSFVLESRWSSMIITDYLDCGAGRPFQRAGRSDLIRTVRRAGTGAAKVLIRFAPRLDFGRVSSRLIALPDGGLEVEGAPDPIVLCAPGLAWKILDDGFHQTAEAEVELTDQPLVLELRYGSGSTRPAPVPEAERQRQTDRFWSGWASTLRTHSVRPDLVRRSALVLKALCFGPTGAMLAAATTSLPEQLGGVRNWDYRYCWPRDASLSAAALVRLGNTGAAMKLLDWLTGVVFAAESPDRLRPIYEITGRELGSEGEIGDLHGYGHSRPVRIGNAAGSQVQLDVFGPIVDLVAMLAERGAPVTPESWRLVEAMVKAVEARWIEPDHGIWEIRGPRRHHIYSKVMCWHAVNRGLVVADYVLGKPRPGWTKLRDAIAADVLANGWNERARAFTGVYGGSQLDAAALAIGLCGLVQPSDPRFVATVECIDRDLRTGPVVYRYREDDGLPGIEGGFQICTYWLVEALAMIGRRKDAERLFEAAASLAGPTGMLSEEYDPDLGISLGNMPQAYSHLGLINAAVRLSMAP